MCIFKKVKIDFDKYYKFKDCTTLEPNIVQKFIDDDYIVFYRGDYNHHQTFQFNMLCDKCKPNDIIKIGFKKYKVISKSQGQVKDDNVYVDDEKVYDNEKIQVLHCTDDNGGRFVMTLKAI